MGLDDLVNKAKGLLGQGEQKAQDAAGAAAAGDTQAAAADAGAAAGLIDKAKELLTDERIDQVAGVIKGKTRTTSTRSWTKSRRRPRSSTPDSGPPPAAAAGAARRTVDGTGVSARTPTADR